jgi:hypothetical protein
MCSPKPATIAHCQLHIGTRLLPNNSITLLFFSDCLLRLREASAEQGPLQEITDQRGRYCYLFK